MFMIMFVELYDGNVLLHNVLSG